MISTTIDVTSRFNADNGYKTDIGLWETVTIQAVNPSGTINITGSNDANAQTGITDGNAETSTNYTAIQATNLATGSAVTAISGAGLYRVAVSSRYLQIGGASAAADKIILFMTKPY